MNRRSHVKYKTIQKDSQKRRREHERYTRNTQLAAAEIPAHAKNTSHFVVFEEVIVTSDSSGRPCVWY